MRYGVRCAKRAHLWPRAVQLQQSFLSMRCLKRVKSVCSSVFIHFKRYSSFDPQASSENRVFVFMLSVFSTSMTRAIRCCAKIGHLVHDQLV